MVGTGSECDMLVFGDSKLGHVVGATILSVEGHPFRGNKYGKYTANGILELFLKKWCDVNGSRWG